MFNDHEKAVVLDSIENRDNTIFWSTVRKYTRKKQFNYGKISDVTWLIHFKGLFNPDSQQINRFALNTNIMNKIFFRKNSSKMGFSVKTLT